MSYRKILVKTNLFSFLILFLFSCNGESQESNSVNMEVVNFELVYGFYIKNEEGVDLLDPEKETSYSYEKIRLYADEELTDDISANFISNLSDYGLVNGPNEDGFMISLGLEMGNVVDENIHEQTYYLQLSENEVDEITVQATSSSAGASISKLIYNDEVIFSTTQEWYDWNQIIVK